MACSASVEFAQHRQYKIPNRLHLIVTFCKAVDKFTDVTGGGNRIEITAQIAKTLDRLHLSDDIPRARLRHQQRGMYEEFEMSSLAAIGLTHALGNQFELAVTRREHCQHTVSIVDVAAPENQAVGGSNPVRGPRLLSVILRSSRSYRSGGVRWTT